MFNEAHASHGPSKSFHFHTLVNLNTKVETPPGSCSRKRFHHYIRTKLGLYSDAMDREKASNFLLLLGLEQEEIFYIFDKYNCDYVEAWDNEVKFDKRLS